MRGRHSIACTLSTLDYCIWPICTVQIGQMYGTLVCQPHWSVDRKPLFLGSLGRRHQPLAHTGQWTSSRFSPGINPVQPVHEWPVSHLMPQVIYADDILLCLPSQIFTEINSTLSADLTCLAQYCRWWHTMNTVTSDFHLHNASAARELSVSMGGQLLKHEHLPVYLGVTLDSTLSYRQHLQKTAAKVRSQSYLLSKLTGSSWGADAVTLRLSAIALCYSVAEYCCPVWSRSAHTNLVDTQLNTSIHLWHSVSNTAAIPSCSCQRTATQYPAESCLW